jgi:hypothetical protein
LLAVAVWVFCIIDVITTPDGQTRNLPKFAWLVLVIILMDIGSIAWLIAGRPWEAKAADTPRAAPGRGRPPGRRLSPDDDEEFLAGLRARAEEQRRRGRESKQGENEPPSAE